MCLVEILDPGPEALDPRPWTLDPRPWTLDPRPWTRGPGPWTRGPGPWTLDPGPWTLDPGPEALDPGPEALDPRPWTLDPRPWTRGPGPWTRGPGPWTRGPGPWTLDVAMPGEMVPRASHGTCLLGSTSRPAKAAASSNLDRVKHGLYRRAYQRRAYTAPLPRHAMFARLLRSEHAPAGRCVVQFSRSLVVSSWS